MKWTRRQALRIGLAAALTRAGIGAAAQGATGPSALLADLLEAHERKRDEDARYTAFAQKADAETYGQVAILFRAASASARVHMRIHASIIKDLGGAPKADGAKPDVGSTKDNLAVAVKDESDEAATLYPQFIAAAQDNNLGLAVRALTYGKAAIVEHVKLYRSALDHPDEWKSGTRVFYVCPVCGNITQEMNTPVCPICHTPKGMFAKIT